MDMHVMRKDAPHVARAVRMHMPPKRVKQRKIANFKAYVADYVDSSPERYAFNQMKRRLHDALDRAA